MKKNSKKPKTAQRKKGRLTPAEQKKISAGFGVDTGATANSAYFFNDVAGSHLRGGYNEKKG